VSDFTSFSLPGFGDVDIWWIDLDRIEDESPLVLTHEERPRAERFRSPCDRARWTSAHVALRQILTGYTEMVPEVIQMTRGSVANRLLSLSSRCDSTWPTWGRGPR
jgi:hypothetical protein